MFVHFFVARLHITRQSKQGELYLRYKSPGCKEDLSSNAAVLTSFCYPLGPDSQTPKECMAAEEYTFTLTQGDGSRLPGFCRRFLPPAEPGPGGRLRYPQVICLITEASWCALFFKVLQIMEQLMMRSDGLLNPANKDLPITSAPGTFLADLANYLAKGVSLGEVIRIPFPKMSTPLNISPPKRIMTSPDDPALECTSSFVELQVPPDSGNGRWNAGLSLARLLWHVPVPAMLTLIASMLLERRVILVGQSRDMVSAAVHAAAALLYPFKWHHIYLPILPTCFKDYLTAPMPFIIGMPAQMLPMLKGIPMSEVTMIDLDLGKCEPAPGGPDDDSRLLPWRDRLESALQAAFLRLRSPTEYESNPFIAGVMQEYFLKLMGSYRKYIHEDQPQLAATSSSRPGASPTTPRREDTRRGDARTDETLKGSGCHFDQSGFVAQHRGGEKARNFLQLLRQSQLYEMFIQERLKMAADGWVTDDGFEARVGEYQERPSTRMREMGTRLGAKYQKTVSKWSAMLKKQQAERRGAGGSGGAAVEMSVGDLRQFLQGGLANGPDHSTPVINISHFFETESDTEVDTSPLETSRSPSMASMAADSSAALDDDRRSTTSTAETSGRDQPSPRGKAPPYPSALSGQVSRAQSLLDKARNMKERFKESMADNPKRPGSQFAPLSRTSNPGRTSTSGGRTSNSGGSPSGPLSPDLSTTSAGTRPPSGPHSPTASFKKTLSGNTKFMAILESALAGGLDVAPAPAPRPPLGPQSPQRAANLWANVTNAVTNATKQQRTGNETSPRAPLPPQAPSPHILQPPPRPPAGSLIDDLLTPTTKSPSTGPASHPPQYTSHIPIAKPGFLDHTPGPETNDMLKAAHPQATISRPQPHADPMEQWDPFATQDPVGITPVGNITPALTPMLSTPLTPTTSLMSHTPPAYTAAPAAPATAPPLVTASPSSDFWDPFQIASFPAQGGAKFGGLGTHHSNVAGMLTPAPSSALASVPSTMLTPLPSGALTPMMSVLKVDDFDPFSALTAAAGKPPAAMPVKPPATQVSLIDL